ncbi:MAG: polymorphic toxin-type HINT domain-containing protein [Isosphaeraceae bacterium]
MILGTLLCGALLAGIPVGDEPPARPTDLDAYAAAKAKAPRTPDAQVKLALWCEAHGLSAERTKHLMLAILLDPANAAARGLLGLISYQGKWQPPAQVARQAQEDPARRALLKEYLQRRARTSDKPDAQWKLALWCEEHGLKDQARAHLYQVLKRDPRRDAAWRRLGFKKIGGRWVKPECLALERAELEAQNRSNKFWKPRLEHWRKRLASRDKTKRAEAEEALGQITDPRAVPMIWSVFARGDEANQLVAVNLLGQIDAPGSARALALLGLFSPSATVRQRCTEILRRRDPREYAGILVAMIRDPIKYKVKQVGGPGSPGAVTIEGKNANIQRRYSPPSPVYIPAFNDTVFPDAFGQPVVYHPLGFYTTMGAGGSPMSVLMPTPTDTAPLANLASHSQSPQQIVTGIRDFYASNGAQTQAMMNKVSTPGYRYEFMPSGVQIPIGQMMAAAEATAYLAQQQLAADVRSIEELNATIAQSNARALMMLADVSGRDFGADRVSWDKWLTDLQGYAYVSPPSPVDKPTFVEEVPISIVPPPPVVAIEGPMIAIPHHSCFGAGTLVWTLEGKRPIEQLRAGDDVLTRNTATGLLSFQPVVTAYHNPPNATYRIDLGSESIVATGIHRFWKAGVGWVMSRDLKAGDRLRTASGVVAVKSVNPDKVQPVFNLQLAEGISFLVGTSGVLAHDNSVVNPEEKPFDRVPAIGEVASAP